MSVSCAFGAGIGDWALGLRMVVACGEGDSFLISRIDRAVPRGQFLPRPRQDVMATLTGLRACPALTMH